MQAPGRRRERILVYGDNGSGKSSCAMSVAKWLAKHNGERGRIYYLDNDRSLDVMLTPTLEKVVTGYDLDVEEYDKWRGAIADVRAKVTKDDWVVLDTATRAWEGAQRLYWSQRSGNDSLAELWLRAQVKADITEVGGDHGANWGVINKFYGEFVNAILNAPCHILLTATAKPIRQPGKSGTGGDPVAVRTWYGNKIDYQVEGQKDLRGDALSVLLIQETPGGRALTTVKEKGPVGENRRALVNEKLDETNDFVVKYLFGVAGWKP